MDRNVAHHAYIALGSNLQDPVAQLQEALTALDGIPQTRLLDRSSLYRTRPVGYAAQPDFVNAVARVRTALQPSALLHELLALENCRGRVRSVPNGPRTLDLDLLLYDSQQIDEDDLTVPHPRMHERAFVLVPLAEIAPTLSIPGRGRVDELLRALDARDVVRIDHA